MKKKSTKESDAEWMRKVNDLVAGKFCTLKLWTPSMINLLVFGSKKSKKSKVIGFGSYDALIVAIRAVPKSVRNPFLYIKTLANDEAFINECNKSIDKVEPGGVITGIADVISKFKKEK